MATDRPETGFYCSTSGTYFSDKESLAEHYKSDFHRYNLKRKVAGLPPVTKDWFEARKAQLSSAATTAPNQKIWLDPLTKKKFQTHNTYLAHVKSKKYQDLVKASGEPAPAPVIMIKQQIDDSNNAAAASGPAANKPSGFTVKRPHRGNLPVPDDKANSAEAAEQQSDEEQLVETDDAEDSGWETASESDDEAVAAAAVAAGNNSSRTAGKQIPADGSAAASDASDTDAEKPEREWEEWDVCVSLFDNKRSGSMQENLEYMYKNFGFYLPDADFLKDPEGLLKYLGAKLQYGKVPIYTAGDDVNAKQFRSLHAVQRHMVDTNQCKMLYDSNEDEYEDFYDYSSAAAAEEEDEQSAEAQGLALSTAFGGLSLGAGSSSSGWELAVQGSGNGGTGAAKALGSRELAKYYRQKPKPLDSRQSVAANLVVAQYRSLGIETMDKHKQPEGVKRAQKDKQRQQRQWLNLAMRTNINNNLPKNVPY